MERYWLIYDGTGRYLAVLGQEKAVLGQYKTVKAKSILCQVEKV